MKIKVVSTPEEITSDLKDECIVHMSFRPNNKDIFKLLDYCPNLEAIQIPKSYYKSIAHFVVQYLNEKGITLLEGDVWGHRGDLYPYYLIPSKVIDTIHELQNRGATEEEIIEETRKVHKISESLAKYLVNYKENLEPENVA